MNDLLDAILFAMGVTLPSVLLLGFGVVLRRLGQVDSAFVATASRLVFNYALPCLLFTQLMGSTIRYGEEARMLAAGLTTALGLFLASELYAWRFVPDVRDRGVFVQGVFRSNMAIMGLAFVQNAYGDAGLPSGAVYVGVVTLLYNVLSVITLSRAQARSGRHRLLDIGRNILTNPLIVSILLAMLLQRLHLGLPGITWATLPCPSRWSVRGRRSMSARCWICRAFRCRRASAGWWWRRWRPWRWGWPLACAAFRWACCS